MKIVVATILGTLLVVAASAGVTVGVMLWAPWDGGDDGLDIGFRPDQTLAPQAPAPTPRPTAPPVQLTGTEAAAKAKRWLGDHRDDGLYTEPITSVDLCSSGEFNPTSNEWIVTCAFGAGGFRASYFATLAVNTLTGAVRLVQ